MRYHYVWLLWSLAFVGLWDVLFVATGVVMLVYLDEAFHRRRQAVHPATSVVYWWFETPDGSLRHLVARRLVRWTRSWRGTSESAESRALKDRSRESHRGSHAW
ncbi:MAG TPA: hypothetical protein VGA20_09315 [Gemmatimonadales bacterium]